MNGIMSRLSQYELTRKGRKRPDRPIDGLLFDPEDKWLIEKFFWTLNPWGYAEARVCFTKHKYTRILLHRVLLGISDNRFGDHINRNKLDNRKSNLRIVTKQMNEGNTSLRSDNSCGFRGVCKDKRNPLRPFRAYGVINGKQKHLGLFASAEEAGMIARLWRIENLPGAVD